MQKLAILFFFCPAVLFGQIRGQVTYVSDGDTFHLVTKDGEKVKVRIADIDCPEKAQAFGLEAKAFTFNQIKGKSVELNVKETDYYGRKVAFVKYDGKDLSAELLKKGLAWHYIKYSNNSFYNDLEKEARSNRIGLWVNSTAIAPWVFRKSKKSN